MARPDYSNTAQPVALVDQLGTPYSAGTAASYTLLTAAAASGPVAGPIRGGDYIWRIEGTWGGATATLQYLGLDGATWKNVRNLANTADVTATADSQIGLGIGQGAMLRVLVTGATAGTTSLNSVIAGLS